MLVGAKRDGNGQVLVKRLLPDTLKSNEFMSTLSATECPPSPSSSSDSVLKSGSCARSKSKNWALVNMARSSSRKPSWLTFCRSWAEGIAFRLAMYSDTFGARLPLYAILIVSLSSVVVADYVLRIAFGKRKRAGG